MSTSNKQLTTEGLMSTLKEVDLDPTDSKILDKIVSRYRDIVGEESNIKVVFLAALSRKLPKHLRIHVANHSRSGAGKSYMLRKLLVPFWHDVVEITKFTDAWLSSSADDLEGKILFWQQINTHDEHGKGITGQLKILLTDEGISYGYMEKINNGWVPRQRHSDALPIVITTTTRPMNDEDVRRLLLLSSDESEDQTRNIIIHNLKKASSIQLQKEIKVGYDQLTYLVSLYEKLAQCVTDVLIPYAKNINKILPQNFHMRTDINKLIQLIKIVAFVHVLNRKMLEEKQNKPEGSDDSRRYIVADIEDLYEAIGIADKIFTQTNYRIPDGSVNLLGILRRLTPNYETISDDQLPTIKDCLREMNIPRATLYSYLTPLKDYGFVDAFKPQGSKEVHLKITGKAVDHFEIKRIEFTENDVLLWAREEFGEGALLVSGGTIA